MLFTGPIEGDSYGLETPSLRALGLLGPARPLAFHEKTRWSPDGYARFEGLLTENARRSLGPELASFEGVVWHEPLPLELARDREPLARLLEAALAAAGIATSPSPVPVAARVLLAPTAALVVCVNETADDATRRVRVDGVALEVPVKAHRARLALVERRTGRVIVATPGEPLRASG